MGIVRWGIAGSGAISEDFALGVLASSKASLQAVAARSKKRAEEFARAHGAKQAYEGYDALAKDPEVDVVYVGVTNQEHKRVSELFLRRGKGVLCEKPATTSRSETNELINISQRNSAFFMEGVWTRFFPVYSKLRALIANNELGRVTYFSAAFAPGNELHEESSDEVLSSKRRLWDPKYYGGILLDMGMYPLSVALEVFNDKEPEEMTTLGVKAVKTGQGLQIMGSYGSGVDVQGAISARFPCDGFASVRWGLRGIEEERFVVSGTKATATIAPRAHAPEHMVLEYHAGEKAGTSEKFSFPLPDLPEGFSSTNYPNSMGFKYEVDAVSEAIENKQLECELYTQKHILTLASMLERARKAMGVYYPHESWEQAATVKRKGPCSCFSA